MKWNEVRVKSKNKFKPFESGLTINTMRKPVILIILTFMWGNMFH